MKSIKQQNLSKKILVVMGPTSTGKTDLGLFLAKTFSGEIVSVDSRQLYVDLDIGTGKMPSKSLKVKKGKGFWEIDGMKIWMYDLVDASSQYNVASYIHDAKKIIKDTTKRGKLPILVGGTGLYLKALIYGLSNINISFDPNYRKQLSTLSLKELQEKLKLTYPKKWEQMNYSDRQNPRRLVRAIEIGKGMEKEDFKKEGLTEEFDILKIGLTAQRDVLYERSDKRVITRVKQGMVKEVERLNKKGLSITRMKELGLEYGVLADFLEGKIETEGQLIKILQNKIHGFIKRQLTWFKKEQDVVWFDVTASKVWKKIENQVAIWYDSPIDKNNAT